jgi:hypothetical protein
VGDRNRQRRYCPDHAALRPPVSGIRCRSPV